MNAKNHETMNCRQVREELLESFDEGQLESLPQPLSEHVAACSSCREELARLRKLANGLKHVPVPDPGDNFRTNLLPTVRFHLDKVRTARRKKDLAWAPSLGLALLMAFVLVRQPATMAPPSWFQSRVGTVSEAGGLTATDYEYLSQALDRRDSLALDLSGAEMDLILDLSDSAATVTEDPIDQLSSMSDEAVEAVLKKLETASIRS